MSISREVLAKYIKPEDVFIETGTKWGGTVIKAIELGAELAFSCELDEKQYDMASKHLADALPGSEWALFNESSTSFLHRFATEVMLGGCVVYLDAHTEDKSPVIQELAVINKWRTKPRVILIDDLRLMESHWKIPLTAVRESLTGMGYAIDFEDGVEKADIMVGYRLT